MNTETLSTLEYMSPETLNGSVYYKESDVYSFGVLAYELLSEKEFTKLEGFQHISSILLNKYRPPIDDLKSVPELNKLIEMCWEDNWKERPDFNSICKILSMILTKF